MNIPRSRIQWTLVGIGLSAFTAGCGGMEDPAQDLVPEELAQVESALCTDSGAADVSGPLGSVAGALVSGTSDSSYGSAACPALFVVEATQTYGKDLSISASWVDTSVRDSQVLCQAARLQATAYGLAGRSWVQLGTKTVAGSWDSFFGCSFSWVPGVEVASASASVYSRVRVAAKAYINTIYGPAYHPVNGTIRIPEPPPEPPK